MTKWYCYLLKSNNPKFINRTYIGASIDPLRRLYEHNNTNKGAKATYITRPNDIVCVISGFTNKIEALQFEWKFKHPEYKKRFIGVKKKIEGINYILKKYNKSFELIINEKYKYLL
jgi:structure-specific endonuclease subunit SLX1